MPTTDQTAPQYKLKTLLLILYDRQSRLERDKVATELAVKELEAFETDWPLWVRTIDNVLKKMPQIECVQITAESILRKTWAITKEDAEKALDRFLERYAKFKICAAACEELKKNLDGTIEKIPGDHRWTANHRSIRSGTCD